MMYQSAQTPNMHAVNISNCNDEDILSVWETMAGQAMLAYLTNNGNCSNMQRLVSYTFAIILQMIIAGTVTAGIVATFYEWDQVILICGIVNIICIPIYRILSEMGTTLSSVEREKRTDARIKARDEERRREEEERRREEEERRREEEERRHNELLALLSANNVVVNNTAINDAMEKIAKKAANEAAVNIHNQLRVSINSVFEGYDIQQTYNTIDHISDREKLQRQLSNE